MKNLDAGTKKMLKTFGIILGAIVVIFIIVFIFMGLSGKKISNKQLVNTLENSAKKYLNTNKKMLPEEGKSVIVTSDTLIANGYMKSFDKLTKNTGCNGEVTVSNNGGEYLYIPSIKCSEYKTETIGEKIKSTVVTSGDGLYKDGDTYYYRGEYVNNYIKIGDSVYRIVSIDKDGNIKVIDPTLTEKSYKWDNRYSTGMGANLGINDYSKSRIRELYSIKYSEYPLILKKYIIKSNWCIGKRSKDNFSINNVDCDEQIEDYLGMITPNEYARVSMDVNCSDIRGGSCNNYNYIIDVLPSSVWTSISVEDNNYQAYAFSNGFSEHDCNTSYRLAFLFNISGNNIFTKGNGSEESPYVVR